MRPPSPTLLLFCLLCLRFLHMQAPISCLSGCLWMPVCVCGQDAVRVVGEFMARDEGEMRFTITALAPSVDEE